MINFLGSTLASGGAVPQVVSAANPLPVTFGGGGAIQVIGTIANGAAGDPMPVITGGRDGAGNLHTFTADASGNAIVVGNVASGVADAGAPVKISGVFNTTLPTVTTGQRVDVQTTNRGLQIVAPGDSNGQAVSGNSYIAGFNIASRGMVGISQTMVYNGATADMLAKPRTNFKLPAAAATNNAASIKASAGTIYAITGFTALPAAGPYWLKFFDTTGVPNPAALAQFREYPLVANKDFEWLFPNGLYFPTGIGVAIVQGSADLNNVAVAAGDVLGLVVEFL